MKRVSEKWFLFSGTAGTRTVASAQKKTTYAKIFLIFELNFKISGTYYAFRIVNMKTASLRKKNHRKILEIDPKFSNFFDPK